MKAKLIKNIKFKTSTVTICYGRNGHLLYEGSKDKIPAHILDYYTAYWIKNTIRDNTYIEVTEDKKWWEE